MMKGRCTVLSFHRRLEPAMREGVVSKLGEWRGKEDEEVLYVAVTGRKLTSLFWPLCLSSHCCNSVNKPPRKLKLDTVTHTYLLEVNVVLTIQWKYTFRRANWIKLIKNGIMFVFYLWLPHTHLCKAGDSCTRKDIYDVHVRHIRCTRKTYTMYT